MNPVHPQSGGCTGARAGAPLRGILDDHVRIMGATSLNAGTGVSWECADAPRYPDRYSALGIRIGVNYVVYAMTH